MKIACCAGVVVLTFLSSSAVVYGSVDTIGPNGINSAPLRLLGLSGTGIGIGMVEDGRPGLPNYDNSVYYNSNVVPTGVFVRNANAPAEPNVLGLTTDHAEAVAGVMISKKVGSDPMTPTGVAPSAKLYASAANGLAGDINTQLAVARATQHVVTRNGGDVRAINLSFGVSDPGDHDGRSQYTSFVDWSAHNDDVLYVVAGNNATDPASVYAPADNFNGITVSSSEKDNGVYRKVSALTTDINFDVEGDRTAIDILAPGRSVDVTFRNEAEATVSGNSIAAPHVTGTAALLQEYAENRIIAGANGWTSAARRHEVMKAVLMNSADKIQDPGDGSFLGMQRTVLDSNGDDWLQSEAYSDDFLPLDDQMGAGHLNAYRAFQQFLPGQHAHNLGPVPLIGWDYSFAGLPGDNDKYVFDKPLRGGSYVSITLAFDRRVNLDVDNDSDGLYDDGDTFEEYNIDSPHADDVISDLDLYLLPKGSIDTSEAIAASISNDSTIDHIFLQIPTTGEYEFWVNTWDDDAGAFYRDYAVAWWAATASANLQDQGDYNGNGVVDEGDYLAWAANFGSTTILTADGSGNGVVDAADYTIWRNHLDLAAPGAGNGGSASVPEPRGMMFVGLVGVVLAWRCVARP